MVLLMLSPYFWTDIDGMITYLFSSARVSLIISLFTFIIFPALLWMSLDDFHFSNGFNRFGHAIHIGTVVLIMPLSLYLYYLYRKLYSRLFSNKGGINI